MPSTIEAEKVLMCRTQGGWVKGSTSCLFPNWKAYNHHISLPKIICALMKQPNHSSKPFVKEVGTPVLNAPADLNGIHFEEPCQWLTPLSHEAQICTADHIPFDLPSGLEDENAPSGDPTDLTMAFQPHMSLNLQFNLPPDPQSPPPPLDTSATSAALHLMLNSLLEGNLGMSSQDNMGVVADMAQGEQGDIYAQDHLGELDDTAQGKQVDMEGPNCAEWDDWIQAHKPQELLHDDGESDPGVDIGLLDLQVPLREVNAAQYTQIKHPASHYSEIHENAAVRVISLLLTYLHTVFHLPHAACTIALSVILFLLKHYEILDPKLGKRPGDKAPRSLHTIYQCTGFDDNFDKCTICLCCDMVVPLGSDPNLKTQCPHCGKDLYHQPVSQSPMSKPKPCQQMPYDLLSEQLGQFLGQPGMEDACTCYLE
ncbi:hypothetical protein DACRYDRAFT_17739 [Dacryopinax primogenitus]|uniref:Uncharacterized protein n=1 Tax=Dacryopinax primogenitus (strain DJM 731) TaxID=1858805 RepID=M5G5R0_DACPD|nr:uncharacterized protein DACRYDRAFT_17739 [Dacryopinax primogenitus]EJT99097.1 hypothetical protein DACRYDRAFT_17739 [Dacryopinax primogenitus]